MRKLIVIMVTVASILTACMSLYAEKFDNDVVTLETDKQVYSTGESVNILLKYANAGDSQYIKVRGTVIARENIMSTEGNTADCKTRRITLWPIQRHTSNSTGHYVAAHSVDVIALGEAFNASTPGQYLMDANVPIVDGTSNNTTINTYASTIFTVK